MSSEPKKAEIVFRGLAASRGIAYGRVFRYIQSDIEVPSYHVDPAQRAHEITRFEQALLTTRRQIQEIAAQVERNLAAEEARIFDAHLMVLEDQVLISETIRELEQSGMNAEYCFNSVSQRYIKAFSEIDDEYLRERAGDIRDVSQRVLQNLLERPGASLSRITEQRVIVANDIAPSAAASIDREKAIAFVTETGGKTSHAVIMARSMNVPAVVGVNNLTAEIGDDDWVLVDGYEGIVIINPSGQTLFRYGKIQSEQEKFAERLREVNELPAVTQDGVPVTLRGNIEKVDDVAGVQHFRADGVGLFRTEYLYMNGGKAPSEEEQYAVYKTVVDRLASQEVVFRTLDLGGDKLVDGGGIPFPKENNPFLGYRAIRFCLDNRELFKDQLRAILRASGHGPVQIMYPMISGTAELARANCLLEECKAELAAKGQAFDKNIKAGTMIEIPSAAVVADLLAEKSSFFSIGTNDLIQYLIAVDRMNSHVVHLYEPAHPAVVRTIKHIVDIGRQKGIPVTVCGEMAGDPVYAALLLGLGVNELSMSPSLIPAIKYLVRSMKYAEAQSLAEEVLQMDSAEKIYSRCDSFYREHLHLGSQ